MTLAAVTFELSLAGCASLKEKRMIVRSLKDRLRNTFNVSVAETGHQDTRDRAEITIALVATDGRRADSILDRVDGFVEKDRRAMILSTRRERW